MKPLLAVIGSRKHIRDPTCDVCVSATSVASYCVEYSDNTCNRFTENQKAQRLTILHKVVALDE